MASCLVPDFPAVMVLLERLKELDEHLKDEEVPFAPEAGLHLAEMAAAVAGLEADRRAAREHLEVESIENSKLRHQINNTRERMSEELVADVAAARASNTEEMELLCRDLSAASQQKEEAIKRQEFLLSQNESLRLEQEQAKSDHDAIMATLNDLFALKYSLQMQLNMTWEKIEELRSSIAGVEQDRLQLEQNIKLEREAFSDRKDNLSKEVGHAEEEVEQQKHLNRRSRRELDSINKKKEKTQGRLDELMVELAKVENGVHRLTVSLRHHEEQLEREAQKRQELRQQREALKEELHELEETFRLTVQNLQEEIATVDGKIEEARASRQHFQDSLAQICEVFKHRHAEENRVRAEHLQVSQQLERSRRQLEERIASIIKHGRENKEMEKQIRELQETDVINRPLFERNREELRSNVDASKKNVGRLQEEKKQLLHLLEQAERKQEEHVEKMTSGISRTRRRYEELLQQEVALQKLEPKSTDANLLMSHATQSEEGYRRIESRHLQEVQQLTADVEEVAQSVKEKQREVEEKEEVLKKVEAEWSKEQSRHQRLEVLINKLRKRRDELELSIQALTEKSRDLLQPKEEMKAELEELQARHIDTLGGQASELRAVEVSIYDCGVKLGQVSMENSRLQLRIRGMTEDIGTARRHTDTCLQETRRFRQDTDALRECLQEAWKEDLLLTQDHQSGDGILLLSISSLVDHLKTRRQQLGNVSALLHQQMLNFSKRLGDKTAGKPCG
ncbi:coiled-coil domain-containing protein 175 [Archocentrus centrarchus]|uniref:coiled-coil domain-containing protein 175 n=1 Tax=Archocentrus centrarchus TaxID=63155 RepID=UPI0011EA00DC|nr:coiled-coil domain-containing protein 175-like [Archocentrus centrarchus]